MAQDISINNNKNFLKNYPFLDYIGIHEALKVATFFENHFVIDYITSNNKINYCFSGFYLLKYCILKNNISLIENIVNNSEFITYNNIMSEKTYLDELSISSNIDIFNLIFPNISFNEDMIIYIYKKSIENNNVILFKYLLDKFNFILPNNLLFNLLIDASPLIINEFTNKYLTFQTTDLFLLHKLFAQIKTEELSLLLNYFDFSNNPPKLFSIFYISPEKYELIKQIYKHMILKGSYKPEYIKSCRKIDFKTEINHLYLAQKINNF